MCEWPKHRLAYEYNPACLRDEAAEAGKKKVYGASVRFGMQASMDKIVSELRRKKFRVVVLYGTREVYISYNLESI